MRVIVIFYIRHGVAPVGQPVALRLLCLAFFCIICCYGSFYLYLEGCSYLLCDKLLLNPNSLL